jgi:hypothetical protein
MTHVPSPGLDLLLSRLSLLTRNWPGNSLDPAMTMRAINPDSRQVPLFWVFTSARWSPALADAIGPDQPLIAMRSLNEVVDKITYFRSTAMDEVSGYYARQLIDHFDRAPCIVGANCQASEVAYRVALHLIDAGVPVRRFVTVDADVNSPLPVPVRVIFGRGSHLNPRNKEAATPYDSDMDLRKLIFPHREFVETPGKHGEYFQPQNVGPLAERILADQPLTASAWRGLGIRWRVMIRAESSITLAAAMPCAPDKVGRLGVVPLLRYEGETFLMRRNSPHMIALPTVKDGMLYVEIELPERREGLKIKPLLCMIGRGPMTWPLQQQEDIAL